MNTAFRRFFRFSQAKCDTGRKPKRQRNCETSASKVRYCYRCRVYFDEYFIVLRRGFVHLLVFKNIRRTIFFINNCFHLRILSELDVFV